MLFHCIDAYSTALIMLQAAITALGNALGAGT